MVTGRSHKEPQSDLVQSTLDIDRIRTCFEIVSREKFHELSVGFRLGCVAVIHRREGNATH